MAWNTPRGRCSDQHGIGAFAMPRRAARVVHAAGHGIVACARRGWLVRFVRVWAETVPLPVVPTSRLGMAFARPRPARWTADNHSKVANDLKHVIDMTAGLVAETLTKVNLPGSSLDEVVQVTEPRRPHRGQASTRPQPDATQRHRKRRSGTSLSGARRWAILQANRGPLEALAAALDEFGEVRGWRRLRAILVSEARGRMTRTGKSRSVPCLTYAASASSPSTRKQMTKACAQVAALRGRGGEAISAASALPGTARAESAGIISRCVTPTARTSSVRMSAAGCKTIAAGVHFLTQNGLYDWGGCVPISA